MRKLSTGQDNILKNWIELSAAVFGADSAPTEFLKQKADESPNGEYAEVIADETQLLMVLGDLFLGKTKLDQARGEIT